MELFIIPLFIWFVKLFINLVKLLFRAVCYILGCISLGVDTARSRSEQRKRAELKQKELDWKMQLEQAKQERIEADRIARIEKEKRDAARVEKERAAQAVKAQKAAERRKAETFKADQARTDIEHYKVQRSELLKLYTELEKQYEQAATDSKKEIAFRKMIALNNQIRGVDRQIEKAQYTINKSGPV